VLFKKKLHSVEINLNGIIEYFETIRQYNTKDLFRLFFILATQNLFKTDYLPMFLCAYVVSRNLKHIMHVV
jgi:hypothetical protein